MRANAITRIPIPKIRGSETPREGAELGMEAMDSFKGVAILVLMDRMEFAILFIEFVALDRRPSVTEDATFLIALTAELLFIAFAMAVIGEFALTPLFAGLPKTELNALALLARTFGLLFIPSTRWC
jgi:hypothetical protein